jgi:hypothetical protein
MPNRNQAVNSGAENALDRFKYEVAAELGIPYADPNIDKGNLPARIHGKVGGNMVKKMIAFAEQALKQGGDQVVGTTVPAEQLGDTTR